MMSCSAMVTRECRTEADEKTLAGLLADWRPCDLKLRDCGQLCGHLEKSTCSLAWRNLGRARSRGFKSLSPAARHRDSHADADGPET